MKKIIQLCIVSLLLTVLLLSGCTPNNQQPTVSIFRGGTEGVTASFEPLGLKEEGVFTVYDTEKFPLEIVLKNMGEEVVPAGKAKLHLIGPSQTDFEGIPQWTITNKGDIDKISEFNPEGGEEVLSFTPSGSLAKYKQKVVGYIDLNWNVEYAYDYKTHLVVQDVCFKGDITDPKVCQVKELKSYAVSGAPVTITGVEQDTAGKGIVLVKITVENKGKGDATIIGQEFDPRFSQVAYTIDEPAKWECKSGGRENQARLVSGPDGASSAQIHCRLKTPLKDDELYVKTVGLTLQYAYKELIQEKLRVKESVR
ncbi:hypothetical protein HYX13_03980 [Candidatus Woesearchaeota archaeon]|nr:hypothetical protein [Candidatus Aenigmarchaeota archaeon]MBI2666744.1 hypothetical protein [Candidatus Woesearchaeota archaeon]